jgi:hypothetical protein
LCSLMKFVLPFVTSTNAAAVIVAFAKQMSVLS